MVKRKRTYEKKPFESTGLSSDVSANLYKSMLLSTAWKALSPKQQQLYMFCKLQLYSEKKKPLERVECFTMNRAKVIDYGLYSDGNRGGFVRDMQSLIEKGFVDCISDGSASRSKTIYAFSARWQLYGTEKYEIPCKVMTAAMLRKFKN